MRLINVEPIIRGLTAMKDSYDAISLDGMIKALEEAAVIDQPPNDPLTLEELREMDGEPVWDAHWGVWGLVDTGLGIVASRVGDLDLTIEGADERLYRRRPEEAP